MMEEEGATRCNPTFYYAEPSSLFSIHMQMTNALLLPSKALTNSGAPQVLIYCTLSKDFSRRKQLFFLLFSWGTNCYFSNPHDTSKFGMTSKSALHRFILHQWCQLQEKVERKNECLNCTKNNDLIQNDIEKSRNESRCIQI